MVTTNVKVGLVISNPNNRDLFNKYLQEIAQYKPLTREAELELFKQLEINPDDKRIIDKLCKHNLLFVVSIAKRYSVMINSSSALTLEDLINDGNIGLYTAIRRFDYKTGNKFISYAVWWIKQSILQSIQNNVKTIRIPGNIRLTYNKINRRENALEQKLGRTPSTLEIFEAMLADGEIDDDLAKVEEIIKINSFETSLNSFVGDEDKTELINLIKDDSSSAYADLLENERKEMAMKILDKSTMLTRAFLVDYFGLEGVTALTVKQIGDKYELSPAAVKSKIDKELRRIRNRNNTNTNYFFPTADYVHNRQWRNGRTTN